jgi:N-methylhydantoinase B
LGKDNIEPGDVIISNVPDITGTHTSDAILFTPIFFQEKLFGYAATKSHWIDLGAKSTYPSDASNIFEEGLRIPPTKIYKKSVWQPEVWEIIKYNSRAPELVLGDMQAQIAGCRLAEKQVVDLLNKYGVATVNQIIQEMYDYSERVTRMAIQKMPEGTWTAEDFMDDNGIELNKHIKTKVIVTIKDGDMTIDLSGSDTEQPGPMNGLWVTTLSSTRSAVKAITSPRLPANEGFNRPIKVIAPKGSIYNAGPTAPSFLSASVSETILELINRALYKVVPERIPACSGGDVVGSGFFGANPKTGKYWGTITPAIIGMGADYQSDGDSYLMFHTAGASQNIPTEILESSFPFFVESTELIQNSGGAGKHRGGLGNRIRIRLTAPAAFYAFIEKGHSPHWGFDGGKDGLRNFALIESSKKGTFEVLKSSGVYLEKDDVATITAGGGGGYGSPADRSLEDIQGDIKDGYISIDEAKLQYKVVADPVTLIIDQEETKKLKNNQN